MATLRTAGPWPRDRYYDAIVEALEGRSPALRAVPRGRLDWYGLDFVLDLYNRTTGQDRAAFIQTLGQIIEHERNPSVVAQVLLLVTSLDVAQVEPNVARLRDRDASLEEPVRTAVADYFAYRAMRNATRRSES